MNECSVFDEDSSSLYMMRLISLTVATLLHLVVATRLWNESDTWHEQIPRLENYLTTTARSFRNGLIFVDNDSSYDTNDIERGILKRVMALLPTSWIRAGSIGNDITADGNLFIFIETSLQRRTNRFVDFLNKFNENNRRPDVLVISLSKYHRQNLMSLLGYASNGGYLEGNVAKDIEGTSKVIVYRIDSLKNDVYVDTLKSGQSLLPINYHDRKKEAVTYCTSYCPAFQFWPQKLCSRKQFFINSPDFRMIQALSQRNGFDYDVRFDKGYKCDMVTMRAVLTRNVENYTFSVPSTSTKMCAITPILKEYRHVVTASEIIMIFMMTCVVVGIFYYSAVLVSFERKIWCLVDTVCVFLGNGWNREPQRAREKIVVVFVVVAFVRFINCLYSDLIRSGDSIEHELEFNDFHDISRSNLTPMIQWEVRASLLKDKGDEGLYEVVKKSLATPRMMDCFDRLVLFKNVTCITNVIKEKSYRELTSIGPDDHFRMSKACVGTYPVANRILRKSPYAERLSVSLLEFEAAGLFGKWMDDFSRSIFKRKILSNRVYRPVVGRLTLTGYCAIGYVLALVVFVGELIVHRYRIR